MSNSDLNSYTKMLEIRAFEEVLCEYIESGEIKTPCHLCIGQEAIPVGICKNLSNEDVIWGNHRSHGHFIAKGGDRQILMDEIFCKETGCSKGRGGSMHVVDREKGILGTVPIVAGTVPLAVGSALKFKLDKEKRISVSFIGDGATEEGHVYESMNMAALYDLPVLFVIENNLYSSHMHMNERRRQHDLQRLGESLGIATKKIDGNNLAEVIATSQELINLCKENNGPAILECMTYRWRGHVGPSWDEDVGLKRKDELKDWIDKDPIKRERNRLLESGFKAEELDNLQEKVLEESLKLTSKARKANFPNPTTLLNHLYC
jgi:pyruvate dehydrogenase E1 component alpha subunit